MDQTAAFRGTGSSNFLLPAASTTVERTDRSYLRQITHDVQGEGGAESVRSSDSRATVRGEQRCRTACLLEGFRARVG